VGVKGLFRNLGYAYILSGRKDRIRGENTHSFAPFCARRRWTAIGVGAIRYNTARAPLSTAIVRNLTSLLYDARCRAPFCTRALLVHVFVVRVLVGDNVDHLIYPDEYHR